MGEFIIAIINYIIWGLGAFLGGLLLLLPETPFKFEEWDLPDLIISFNEFLPIAECLATLALWVAAIAIYYIYQVVLRWLKAVQ